MATYKTGLLITGDASGAVKATKLTKDELGKLSGTSKKATQNFSAFGRAAKALGPLLAGIGIGKLTADFVSVVKETDRLRGSLTTITGSTEMASKAFAALEQFASQTPVCQ